MGRGARAVGTAGILVLWLVMSGPAWAHHREGHETGPPTTTTTTTTTTSTTSTTTTTTTVPGSSDESTTTTTAASGSTKQTETVVTTTTTTEPAAEEEPAPPSGITAEEGGPVFRWTGRPSASAAAGRWSVQGALALLGVAVTESLEALWLPVGVVLPLVLTGPLIGLGRRRSEEDEEGPGRLPGD